MAHSAYPELGESAIEKLLDALQRIRHIDAAGTMTCWAPAPLNIGTIIGRPRAERDPRSREGRIFIRLVDDGDVDTASACSDAVATASEAKEVLRIPALRLGSLTD